MCPDLDCSRRRFAWISGRSMVCPDLDCSRRRLAWNSGRSTVCQDLVGSRRRFAWAVLGCFSVLPGTGKLVPGAGKMALEGRFPMGDGAKFALERRSARPDGTKLALKRCFVRPDGAKLAVFGRFSEITFGILQNSFGILQNTPEGKKKRNSTFQASLKMASGFLHSSVVNSQRGGSKRCAHRLSNEMAYNADERDRTPSPTPPLITFNII